MVTCWLLFAINASVAWSREWTSNSGVTTDAQFYDLVDGHVWLLARNGGAVKAPVSEFCQKDQALLKELARFSRSGNPPDVLETRTSKYPGKITRSGDKYKVVRADGKTISIPASLVKRVSSGAKLLEQFKLAASRTNLHDDKAVQQVAQRGEQYGLDIERNRLLTHAYLVRLETCQDSPAKLRLLAAWCDKVKLAYGEQLLQRAAKAEFPARLRTAGANAQSLAKLSIEMRDAGLPAEAANAAAAARSKALPADNIELWLNPAWQVIVLKSRIAASFSETSGGNTLFIKPKSGKLALVRIRLMARRSSSRTVAQRIEKIKAQVPGLSKEAARLLAKFAGKSAFARMEAIAKDISEKPARLFVGMDCKLQTPGGAATTVLFSSEIPGYGVTLSQGTFTTRFPPDEAVLAHHRSQECVIFFAALRKEFELELVFPVAEGAKSALLYVDGAPSLSVKFGS